MDKLKPLPAILIFTDWFLPGYKAGGPIRSIANLIAHLQGDFNFYVLTRNTDYQDSVPYQDIPPNRWIKQNSVTCNYLSRPGILNILKILREFKKMNPPHSSPSSKNNSPTSPALYINGIWSFYFSILPLFLARVLGYKHIIVAPRGMLSSQTWTSSQWKKIPFLLFARLTGLYRNVVFHATSESEMEDILRFQKHITEVVVIPNLPRLHTPEMIPTIKQSGELRLVSIARIAPEKNTLFMLEILQQCTSGKILLDLYGPVYNEKYWESCRKVISALPQNIRVEHHGALEPENIGTVFSHAHFLFMPSTGENFGHTILESLQHGVPVIISDRTPWKNLEEKEIGWDLPLDQPGEFLRVLNLCVEMDESTYNNMLHHCVSYMEKIHNLDIEIKQYHQLFH